MGYEFRKLYADLVTEDGTLCILYLTGARLLGGWHARSGAEIYRPDGTRTVLQGRSNEPPEPEESAAKLSITLRDGPFEMRFETEHGACAPETPPCAGLEWRVKVARGRVHASGPGVGVVRGVGYADWVTMTRAPRSLGLRTLHWGRAHVGKESVVFTAITFVNGASWSLGARWKVVGAPATLGPAAPELDEEGSGSVQTGDATLRLAPERVLHAGPALDAERAPSWVDRAVARAIGGKVEETRWLGKGRLDGNEALGRAVYERVRFG